MATDDDTVLTRTSEEESVTRHSGPEKYGRAQRIEVAARELVEVFDYFDRHPGPIETLRAALDEPAGGTVPERCGHCTAGVRHKTCTTCGEPVCARCVGVVCCPVPETPTEPTGRPVVEIAREMYLVVASAMLDLEQPPRYLLDGHESPVRQALRFAEHDQRAQHAIRTLTDALQAERDRVK